MDFRICAIQLIHMIPLLLHITIRFVCVRRLWAVHRIRVMLLLLLLLSFNKKIVSECEGERGEEWERRLCADTAQPQVALHADTFYLLFSEGLKEIFCLHIIFYQTFFPRRKNRCSFGSRLGLADLLVWTRWWWTHTQCHNVFAQGNATEHRVCVCVCRGKRINVGICRTSTM